MDIRTKVICTIGPSCDSFEMIMALIESGMNVARLNFSHGTHEEHLKVIQHLKNARSRMGVPVAIMLDTKGPEIRLGKIKDNRISLKEGDHWQLFKKQIEGDEKGATITPSAVLDNLKPGVIILFDDGYISSKVIQVNDEGVVVEIENGGDISSSKGVNIPNASLKLPALTSQDISDIRFGCQHGID